MSSSTQAGSRVEQQLLVDLEQPLLRVGLAGQRRRLLAQLLVQARVGDRDGGLAGEHLEQLGIGGIERVARLGVDGQRADRAVLADERGAHHRSDAVLADVAVGRLGVGELRIGQVVAGADHPALDHRATGDALVELDRVDRLVALDRQVDRRVAERPVQAAGVGHQLDPAAVGVEQPHGLVERALQDVARVADGGDACRDLAERALRLHPPLELLVQPGVAEHDGRLAGERTEQLGVVGAERVGPRRVGADRPERPGLADERRAHLGVIPVAA